MAPRAFISGLSSLTLTSDERAFLREAGPWGLILFKRNIQDRAQVSELVSEAQHELGREAPVLIDQEGGRVQRLGPPHWPAYPPGAAYGKLYDRDQAVGLEAARLGARLIAADLAELGISVDCLPLADVPIIGADAVIGDRAYGELRPRSRPLPPPLPKALPKAACCRCSSTSPAMAAPTPTATSRCPSCTPTAQRWRPLTLPHSVP